MRSKRWIAALAAASLLAAAACSNDEPQQRADTVTTPSPTPPPECPLTGLEPDDASVLDRPAVAVKIENDPVAYPLSGLENAEVVYEELIEGGITRFMAIYHCTDAALAGPMRSARFVDPAIMKPITRILAAAGGNAFVRKKVDKSGVVLLHEDNAGRAIVRVDRPGVAFEHTLYGKTQPLRNRGSRKFDAPPPEGIFSFGELEGDHPQAQRIDIKFSKEVSVVYRYKNGRYRRFDRGAPLKMASGDKVTVDNVLIEQHEMAFSKRLVDVLGTPSVVFKDKSGKGKAVLFRDGVAIKGRWQRDSANSPARFTTKDGEEMIFAPGTIWIELVPTPKGEVKGRFSFSG